MDILDVTPIIVGDTLAMEERAKLLKIAKYQAIQKEGGVIDGADWGCGGYDLVRIDNKLMRAPKGYFLEPLLHAPLPPEYWALERYNPVYVPTRLEVFANFVQDLTRLSKCEDRHTAAIITDVNMSQIYSIGVNGGPKGSQYQCLCKLPGKYTCIHAEANAIAKCTSADNNKIMICSLSPCVTCASLIVNSGFSAVYYLEEWKDTTGLEILNEAGIETKLIGGHNGI